MRQAVFGAAVATTLLLSGGNAAQAVQGPSQAIVPVMPASAAATTGTWGTASWVLEDGVLTVGPGDLAVKDWSAERAGVSRIVFTDPDATRLPVNSALLFAYFSKLTAIDGAGQLDTSRVTNMAGMLTQNPLLSTIDVSGWDTSNVTNMNRMFQITGSLTSLDVAGWDTSKVTDMGQMFGGASALTTLDVSGWETGNVLTMKEMFHEARSLTQLDVSDWDTGNVRDMSSLFYNASELTALDVSNWDVSKVTNLYGTFSGVSKVQELDVTKWETGEVTSLNRTFWGMAALHALDPSNWDTSKVNNTAFTFQGASSIPSLDLAGWDMSQVTDMQAMFQSATSLATLNVSGWDTGNVVNMEAMFHSAVALGEIDVTAWDTGKVENFRTTFYDTFALTVLNPSGFDTSSALTMEGMFSGASAITDLELSTWDTSKVWNMSALFQGTTSLVHAVTTGWDTSSVTEMDYLYTNSGAHEVSVAGWDVQKVRTLFGAFAGMENLTMIDLTGWDTEHLPAMEYLFSETPLRVITISDETAFTDDIDLWSPSSVIEPLANGNWVEIGTGTTRLPIATDWDGVNNRFYELTQTPPGAGTYIWQETIEVIYHGNAPEVTGDTSETPGATGRAVTVAENGFEWEEHGFLGWNTKPDGSGTAYAAGDTEYLAAGTYNLYAQWERPEAPVGPEPVDPPEKVEPPVQVDQKPGTKPGGGLAATGGTMQAWIASFAALLAATGGVLVALRRRRSRPAGGMN